MWPHPQNERLHARTFRGEEDRFCVKTHLHRNDVQLVADRVSWCVLHNTGFAYTNT